MPLVIPSTIPAYDVLNKENIFVMSKEHALRQDIRPIEILILNLMPTKIETETQLLRLLANTPLQVHVTFLTTESYSSQHTAKSHLDTFYVTFDAIKERKFDGMIVTGAPVEHLPFEAVKYWQELQEIFDYAETAVTNTIYICWGAYAALYYKYGISKIDRPAKCFGVFKHQVVEKTDGLLKGLDDVISIPHSSHCTVHDAEIDAHPELEALVKSSETGNTIIKSKNNRSIFITGHLEYDRYTLQKEYERDVAKGKPIAAPRYFDASTDASSWFASANLIYANWLNHYVYQITPYQL